MTCGWRPRCGNEPSGTGARAQPILVLRPDTPAELARLYDEIEAHGPGSRGCTWLEAAHSADTDAWDAAWLTLAMQLNHRREALRSRLGGLVLVLPSRLKPAIQQTCSDLWSIIDFLAEPVIAGGGLPIGQTVASKSSTVVTIAPAEGRMTSGQDPEWNNEVAVLVAMSDDELVAGSLGRLEAAIDRARYADDRDALATLLTRRAQARLADRDRAGARSDLEELLDLPGLSWERQRSAFESAYDVTTAMADWEAADRLTAAWVKQAEQLYAQIGGPQEARDLSLVRNKVGKARKAKKSRRPRRIRRFFS